MITGELKSRVDKIWNEFWSGGITNPFTVIEQFTYLLFIKGLDDKQNEIDSNAEHLGITAEKIFPEDKQDLRWHNFKQLPAEKMFELFVDQKTVSLLLSKIFIMIRTPLSRPIWKMLSL